MEVKRDFFIPHESSERLHNRFFPGSIDEVRIYDRALSAAEVAWLAGRSAPFDKP